VKSGLGKNSQEQTQNKKYYGQQRKKMVYDEPHLMPNEKSQSIQWTKWPTGALVTISSL
jgi:hypothetical protein